MIEPTKAEAYWHEKFVEIKNPHKENEVFRFYFDQPQREWVGLTDEEMKHIEETTTCLENESWLRNLTRNIEDKLRSKNT